jgi:hypothetical protein
VKAWVVVLNPPPTVRKLSSVVQFWLPEGAHTPCAPAPCRKPPAELVEMKPALGWPTVPP